MSKVLVIYSSPTGNFPRGSISTTITKEFLKTYRQLHPGDQITELDLNREKDLQSILTSENIGTTFYTPSNAFKYIEQLKNVDKVIIAAPMINVNYSVLLKNYMDRISVAGMTFKYKEGEDGVIIGLLPHLKVQILATHGSKEGTFKFGSVATLLAEAWKLFGVTDIQELTIFGVNRPKFIQLPASEIAQQNASRIQKAAQAF